MVEARQRSIAIVERLKAAIDRDLRAYPYPITACDVAFKLYSEQRGLCRVILAGLAGEDGLGEHDAHEALTALMSTPLTLDATDRAMLRVLADQLADHAVAR